MAASRLKKKRGGLKKRAISWTKKEIPLTPLQRRELRRRKVHKTASTHRGFVPFERP
jgi:hypothetical protein